MKKSIEKKLDQLDIDLRILFKDLEGYSEPTLNKPPKTATWSVFQIMHHLMLAEQLSFKYVQKKIDNDAPLNDANIISKMRGVFINSILKLPIKAKAPTVVADLPEYSTFWEVVKQWKGQREYMRAYFKDLPEEFFNKEIYKHPMGGRISIEDMLSFFQNHYKRHLKQINKTLHQLNAVKIK